MDKKEGIVQRVRPWKDRVIPAGMDLRGRQIGMEVGVDNVELVLQTMLGKSISFGTVNTWEAPEW